MLPTAQVRGSGRTVSPSASVFLNLLISLRPGQWTKNLFVFAALVFAQRLTDPAGVVKAAAAFVVFCALSSTVYLINDVLDREQDRRHPLKANRPIASGAIGSPLALTVLSQRSHSAGNFFKWRARTWCCSSRTPLS
jgi:heme O synthase-like polyprenyltransferase